MGFRSPPKRNPASLQAATGTRSRAPRPNLSPPARAPRPPLWGPTHLGSRYPHRAAAAPRTPGHRGIPGSSPARLGPRAQDRLRALPPRPRPARVRSQLLEVQSSSPAGRVVAAAAARAPPSAEGGGGRGAGSGRRGGRFLEGRALPRAERGRYPARPPPAAGAPRHSGLSVPRGPECSRPGSECPNVRGRDPRI